MSIRCPNCGAEFDVTLFTFDRKIQCDCGAWVDMAVGHQQLTEHANQEANMAKRQSKSTIKGRWAIVSMTEWDEEYLHEEEQAFIDFSRKNTGDFHFGYVHGQMDCRATERGGEPAVEFTWEGNDESEHAFGRGWAILDGNRLDGMIFFHNGEDSEFTAERADQKSARKRK